VARDDMDAMFEALDITIDRCIKYGLTDEQMQAAIRETISFYMGNEREQ
jgi:hypothetical protein